MNIALSLLRSGRQTLMPAVGAFAVGASLLFSGGAAAQVYKCKGADGRVVYGDARCGTSEERTEVDVRDNVIETSTDMERVQRQLAQQEREAAAAERQRIKEEKQRTAKRKTSTRKAAKTPKAVKKEAEADGTPEHRRRVKAQERRIKAMQKAQQQRVTPYSQR